MILVVAIDIGIIHLGMVWAHVDPNILKLDMVQGCALINLVKICDLYHKKLRNSGGAVATCSLQHHSNMLTDRMEHFFLMYHHILDASDFIFVEQQPPQGHTAVEQLFVNKYRHKIIMISPRSLHRYFSMHLLGDYEKRKIKSQELASQFEMSTECKVEFDRLVKESTNEYNSEERVHDICDAMLILKFGLYLEQKKPRKLFRSKQSFLKSTIPSVDDDTSRVKNGLNENEIHVFFNQFRHHIKNS